MTEPERIDAARAEAMDSLVGQDGILGVGRTEHTLVFFVRDASAADDPIRRWSADRDVAIEVLEVGRFRSA